MLREDCVKLRYVHLHNGDDVSDVKTSKMIWTMGKVSTGSVFDGGGGDLVLDRDILKRGLCRITYEYPHIVIGSGRQQRFN